LHDDGKRFGQVAGGRAMRLLTWNIQWGRGMDGRVDIARIIDTVRALGAFDVICLQEVAVGFDGLPGSRGEDEVALLARGFPGYVPVWAVATDLPGGPLGRRTFGNLLLSRLPVGQVWRHLLPWPADSTVPSMQRVMIEAVVQAPFGALRVQTTHLEYYSRRQREAQIDAIRSLHVEACAHARNPRPGPEEAGGSFEVAPRPLSAVLCGDMNFPATAAERTRLLAPFDDATPVFLDSWSVRHPALPHAPTVGIHPVDFVDAPACFDFVFITADLAPRVCDHGVDPDTQASDHQPVWIELADV
jgi:endonuclease/exonuclease/phosphatase family metal-dependent hydrolase